jgi:hypothetical protein
MHYAGTFSYGADGDVFTSASERTNIQVVSRYLHAQVAPTTPIIDNLEEGLAQGTVENRVNIPNTCHAMSGGNSVFIRLRISKDGRRPRNQENADH